MEPMLRRLIGEQIELVTKLDARRANGRTDPGQIEQVILNLSLNARDAMPVGGTLTIETRNGDLDGRDSPRFPGGVPGSVTITVRDTGRGIDVQAREHLFEPFYTTKQPGEGTGLGLSTVYSIVQQTGGTIDVDSTSGRGSAFRIHLPLDADPSRHPQAHAGEARPLAGDETVLLVEDEDLVRRLVRAVLEQHGYRVIEASSPGVALELSQRHGGAIDLLLTDVVMPDMGGQELAAARNEDALHVRLQRRSDRQTRRRPSMGRFPLHRQAVRSKPAGRESTRGTRARLSGTALVRSALSACSGILGPADPASGRVISKVGPRSVKRE